MNCSRRWIFTPKVENIIKYQIIRGIFQFWRKSLFDDSNGDLSPVFAWRFWRKFLAMGSTGNGAALGAFSAFGIHPFSKCRLRLRHNYA